MEQYFKKRLAAILAVAVLLCAVTACGSSGTGAPPTVHIAVPYEEQLFGINEEYYKGWLEEQSGLAIEFVFIPQSYTAEYLRMLLSGQNGEMDAIFFSEDSALSPEELADYGAKGSLVPLEVLIDSEGAHISQMFAQHNDYNLRRAITSPDGHIYYMPALQTSSSTENFQTLWINIDWLEGLGLTIPATTAEFEQVLRRFAEQHPDGAPLIGSAGQESLFVCNFLMNSFATCDPKNSYMAVENGKIVFPPVTSQWRAGLAYCNNLYEAGLLPAENFTYTPRQLTSFCNDPRNLAGAFTAKRMSDILSQQSPQLLSRYMAVPPLEGPQGAGMAVVDTPLPRPGGVILATSQNQQKVFRLMDLMCSEEAFLIGHYGQPGVDWDKAEVGDITIGGEPATIAIKNTDKLRRDEDISRVVGPFIARAPYADNVAWKGYQVNQSAYLEARAFRVYQPYVSDQYIRTILFSKDVQAKQEHLRQVSDYTKQWMLDFITEARDIDDDAAWAAYLEGFAPFDLESLTQEVQRSYDGMEG